ncbi:hypothetical protein ACP4OV_020235 [Aristida adscensionis]
MAAYFFQLLVLTTVASATARNISPQAPTPAPSPSSTAVASFLRASCANTGIPETCYSILLPYADSFHGSLARVARAGAGAAVARQRGLMDEFARLMLRGTGAGRAADMTLADCYNGQETSDRGAKEMLSYLDRLVAGVGSKEFDEQVWWAGQWLSSSDMIMCVDWFNMLGEAVVSSPVVQEVIVGSNDLYSYMHMGLILTLSIKF